MFASSSNTKVKLLIFGLYLGVTLVVTFPLILNLNSLIIDRYDSLFITWVINWLVHSFTSGPAGWANIFNTNIFYPYQNTLAFSDYHLVSALIALPFVFLFKEPLLAFNINFLAGFVLTGFSGYLLARQLTGKDPVAFLAGILLAFSTIHLNYMAHLQLFHLWLLIFALLFLLQNRWRLYSLFFILAVLNSPLNLYFLLFMIIVYVLTVRKNIRSTLMSTIIACLVATPFLLPFFFVSRQFHYTRPITDAIHFSLQYPDLFNISSASRLSAIIPPTSNLTPAYFGGVFSILLISLLVYVQTGFKKLTLTQKRLVIFFLTAAFLALILAFGPAFHIFQNTVHVGPIPAIPMPYLLLYYLVPGFFGFRTPSRWIIVTALALCLAIAILFAKKLTWPFAIILSIFVVLEINYPFKYFPIPPVNTFPPEQIWLKNHFIGAPIIQLPIYGWFDPTVGSEQVAQNGVGLETLREYYSTAHWHSMYNGYSGFSPVEWEQHVQWLQKNFPSPQTIRYLQQLQIELVLTPSDWDLSSWQKQLKLIAHFPQTNIYQLFH